MNNTTIFRILAAGSFFLLFFGAGSLRGQKVQLSINPTSISFAAADPDLQPQVSADWPVQVTVKVAGNNPWSLTLRANGNLSDSSTTASIAISNISWTATPSPPFQNGTLASNVDQVAASSNRNFNWYGDLNFIFQNQWTYWAGQYSQTVTVTLTVL